MRVLFLLLACVALCLGQTVLILDNDNVSDTTNGIQASFPGASYTVAGNDGNCGASALSSPLNPTFDMIIYVNDNGFSWDSCSATEIAAMQANIEAYANLGKVFLATAYDNLASPTDNSLAAVLGGGSIQDVPTPNSVFESAGNCFPLLRGAGGDLYCASAGISGGDYDAMFLTSASGCLGVTSGRFMWTVRPMANDGVIVYISDTFTTRYNVLAQYDIALANLMGYANPTGTALEFSETFPSGQPPTSICNAWTTFIDSVDQTPGTYPFVTMSSSLGSSFTCSSQTEVDQIAAFTATCRSGSICGSVSCGGVVWSFGGNCVAPGGCTTSGNDLVVTVNSSPQSSCSCFSYLLQIRAHINNSNWGGQGTSCGSTGQTLTMAFGDSSVPPTPAGFSGCPSNVVTTTAPSTCSRVVSYATPTNDVCTVTQTAGLSSGSAFSPGTTTNTFSTPADSCSFTVTVTDNESPTLSCPANVNLNAPSGACAVAVPYTVTSSDNCPGLVVTQTSGLPTGSLFAVGTTTNAFQAVDVGGTTVSCSFAVAISDVESPTLTCPSDITVNNDPGLCSSVITYNILTADNCPSPTAVLLAGLPSGSAFVVGSTSVIYNAVDGSGNTAPSCGFAVTVVDAEAPTIVCPADVTLTPNSSLDCSAQFFFNYIVADNCETIVTSSHQSGSFFTGSTTITGTVSDNAGNSATCSFVVNVVDTVSPTINCYSATSATDPGTCSATVFFRDPDAFDVCGVDITRAGSAVSGQSYAPGVYSSTFTATDPSGNFDSCVSSIQVLDLEPPVVTGCPADIEVNNSSGCDEVVTWDDSFVTRSDNCGVTSSGQSHTPGSTFPLGLTSVSYTARDAAGNTGQCSFVVRVIDDQSISYNGCPAAFSIPSSCSDSGTPANWVEPTVSSDECLTYQSRNFAPGSRFPDGVTTINYVAVADEAWATCLFEVTVEACPAESGGNRPPGAIGTIDLDGDGYYSDAPLIEWRDCCDSPEDLCDDPFLVNPGAFEIAANGQQDSCRGTSRSNDADGHIGGCDRNFVFANDFQLVGPTIPSEQTNEAVWALDLCEFKEDDDDPSWGFDEQQTMIFSLANGTRNGYDIGIVGPATTQAAVVDHYGGIVPARGDFMLAMSSGTARDEATGGHQPATGATTGNTIVNLPASFLDSGASTFTEDCGGLPYAVGVDSIRAHFRMRQPTNMHAFSFQALYMDFELEAAQGSYPALGGTCDADRKSWFLAIKSDSSTGVSGNFAGDNSGRSFNSFNANPSFWSQCNDYGDFGAGLCRDGASSLDLTGFTGASNWTPIGTSAEPGESFSLEFVTFDGRDGANDVTVLLDDFFPITEARTAGSSAWASQPWGYQYTADLEMVHFGVAGGSPLLASTATSVSLDFTLRNWGPEEANDVTVSFTPPLGSRFTAAKDATGASLSCVTQAAAAPYVDNGLVKCKWASNAPLANQATLSGSLSFSLDLACAACPKHTRQMRFRLTSTLSSIDRQLSNNYLTTDVTFV